MDVIIGTLSGFIVAFFAEPIKQLIMNRIKKHNLRKAIHYEIYHNWVQIESVIKKDSDENVTKNDELLFVTKFLLRTGTRNECYLHLINEETAIFYQMKEAANINLLYSYINGLYEWSKMSNEDSKKFNPKPFIDGFVSQVEDLLATGEIDKRYMQNVTGVKL